LVTAVLVMSELVATAAALGAALSATVAGTVAAIAIGALVLVIGWVLVTMLRLAPGKIILSPAGVSHRGLTSAHFIPWHAIVAISAGWLGTPVIAVKAKPSPDTRVRRYLGRFRSGEVQFLPAMVIRTAWLATSPTALYHALSFYGSYPDLRTELGTHDAIDRISNGQAVGQQEP
jgi:dipeptide/tripeptide permease